MGVLRRYLEIKGVVESDQEDILTLAKDLAEDDGEVLMGSVVEQIFNGLPSLQRGLTYEMYQHIRKEKPELLEPLRKRARERGAELMEDPGPISPGVIIVEF